MSADAIEIIIDIEAGAAQFGEERLPLSPPHRFWSMLADRFGDRFVHLVPADGATRHAERRQALALAAGRQADAVIGRVTLSDGRRSPYIFRPHMLAYLPLAPGALLCRASAAAGAAAELDDGLDMHWARDLGLALARRGPVLPFDGVLAECTASPPHGSRVPPARARLTSQGTEDGFVLVYGRLGASTSLYFDGLPAPDRAQLRMLEPGDLFSDLPWLAAARLVIIVRGFEFAHLNGALDLLGELGTPVLWFTDDDFIALGGETASLGHYRAETVRRFAQRLAGIVTTSAPLAAALSPYHASIAVLPLAADPALLARRPATPSERAAIIGGGFRAKALTEVVAPAATAEGVPLILPAGLPRAPHAALRLPFDGDFAQFIFRWQAEAPFALLHPHGDSGNIGNKSRGTLLVAAYLGAVPIVADEPAYQGLGEGQGVLSAGRKAAEWRSQIARLKDAGFRGQMLRNLDAWVASECDADVAGAQFRRIVGVAGHGGPLAAADRLGRALESRTFQQALPRRSALVRHWRRLSASLGRRIDRWINPR